MRLQLSTPRLLFPLVLLLVLASREVCATATDAWLYRARVAVADDSEAARVTGFRRALAQVVVKLAGPRQVLDQPQLAPLLDAAADLVEEYRYQPSATDSTTGNGAQPAEGAPAQPVPGVALEVRFVAVTLDAELRRLGVPRWPAERRPVLLWLGGTDQERSTVSALVREVLEARGVPVLEPLWDLQDTLALGDSEPEFDPGRIAEASRRYEARHWLILEPRLSGDAMAGKWQLGGDLPAGNEAQAGDLRGWIQAAVDAAIDALAAEQVYLPGSQEMVMELGIDGVATYDAYRAVMDALEALEVVRALEVKAMTAGRVNLRVQLDGAPELLWQALADHPRFAEVTDVAAGAGRLYLWREP